MIRRSVFALMLLFALSACQREDAAMDLVQAYSEIGAAIDFKRQECGAAPSYPLLLPGRPSEYGIRLCSLTITRQACPFNDYPIFCFEIYTVECENCDVPLIGP